jgi:hypothetical protein
MEQSDFKYFIDFYKDQQYETENFYTIDWVDTETCLEMCKFADKINKKYDTLLSIPFLILAGMDFMSGRMDCPSCMITEDFFEEFEQFLVEKAKEHKL